MEDAMPITLPKLPYPMNALEPSISAHTLQEHHGRHHKTYVEKTNALLADTGMADWPLEEIVKATRNGGAKTALYNNAAQAWNHDFYWHSLSPKRRRPAGALLHRLEKDFGSYDGFAGKLAAAANGQFGSGWAWLVEKDGKLEVTATANADTPMAHGIKCLLTVDVWEHAYYVDYRNERERYVSAILDRLNWQFVEKNLG
jgi:Fe-Mn family superoxide dismutase